MAIKAVPDYHIFTITVLLAGLFVCVACGSSYAGDIKLNDKGYSETPGFNLLAFYLTAGANCNYIYEKGIRRCRRVGRVFVVSRKHPEVNSALAGFAFKADI